LSDASQRDVGALRVAVAGLEELAACASRILTGVSGVRRRPCPFFATVLAAGTSGSAGGSLVAGGAVSADSSAKASTSCRGSSFSLLLPNMRRSSKSM
jgi:hypothetical protein